jgi:hypothetical protein
VTHRLLNKKTVSKYVAVYLEEFSAGLTQVKEFFDGFEGWIGQGI